MLPAHEFWDGNNLLGEQYKQVLGWRGNAWDVYMVYGPQAQWNTDLPPTPTFSCTRLPKRARFWTPKHSGRE